MTGSKRTSVAEAFFDTNVLLYLFSADVKKADRVEEILVPGATISVQVLNEFASVALRKLGMKMADVREALDPVKSICAVVPLTVQIHERGLQVAERYGFSVYDALVVSAALDADCTTLYSEDLQHGQVIDRTLRIVNPFRR